MSEKCELCGELLNPHDIGIWKQVIGWVGGPKKDSMRLREDTGKFAHNACVEKLQSGQAIDQPSMFEEELSDRILDVLATGKTTIQKGDVTVDVDYTL